MRSFSLAIATVAALASQANAFWGTAHLLVSRGAQTLLENNNPTEFAAALAELATLAESHPELVEEKNNPFTECATFGDDVKGKGYSFQSGWHYINAPYLDEEGTTLDDFSFTQPDYDVVKAMTDLTAFLKGELQAEDSYYVKQIAEKLSDEADQRSFALRLIVHYVGDVHQPLHSTALVDSKYPSGDRGGNSETIPSKDGVKNLHYVWDSVLYEYTGRPSLPLSDSAFDWYTTESNRLAEEFEMSPADLNSKNFSEWAQEGLELSEQGVYPDFVEGEDPDQAYIDENLPLMETQMVRASYRLADLVVDIYGTSSAATAVETLLQ